MGFILLTVTTQGCNYENPGAHKPGDGQFNGPTSVSVNSSSGNVYVSDSGNIRIEEFGNVSSSSIHPIAFNQTNSTTENEPINLELTGTDHNLGHKLVFKIVTPPDNGTLNVNGNISSDKPSTVVTYTPKTNFTGTDSFTFKIIDSNITGSGGSGGNDGTAGGSESNIATVGLTVYSFTTRAANSNCRRKPSCKRKCHCEIRWL